MSPGDSVVSEGKTAEQFERVFLFHIQNRESLDRRREVGRLRRCRRFGRILWWPFRRRSDQRAKSNIGRFLLGPIVVLQLVIDRAAPLQFRRKQLTYSMNGGIAPFQCLPDREVAFVDLV